jgi:hypothetical protein
MECSYGCGREGIYLFKNGKVCCSNTQSKCDGVRNKIAMSLTGKKQSDETKKKRIVARSWYKHSEETKRKIGESNSTNKRPDLAEYNKIALRNWSRGEKHYLWQGGKRKSKYCVGWIYLTRELKESDNNKCQSPICENRGHRITTHHIDYNKENCHPSNLITLCNSCNCKANVNREWWTEFYKKLKEGKENSNQI